MTEMCKKLPCVKLTQKCEVFITEVPIKKVNLVNKEVWKFITEVPMIHGQLRIFLTKHYILWSETEVCVDFNWITVCMNAYDRRIELQEFNQIAHVAQSLKFKSQSTNLTKVKAWGSKL